jgi:hypothetical protein
MGSGSSAQGSIKAAGTERSASGGLVNSTRRVDLERAGSSLGALRGGVPGGGGTAGAAVVDIGLEHAQQQLALAKLLHARLGIGGWVLAGEHGSSDSTPARRGLVNWIVGQIPAIWSARSLALSRVHVNSHLAGTYLHCSLGQEYMQVRGHRHRRLIGH